MASFKTNVYVLSGRKLISTVAWDPIFELENLLVRMCDGQLLLPTARGITQWLHGRPKYMAQLPNKIVRHTIGLYNLLDGSFKSQERRNILFIIGISGADLGLLSSLPRWRQYFDVVVAYISDAWGVNTYPKHTHHIDHLFVPHPEIIEPLQKYFGIPVSLLPLGSDVLTHGSGGLNRPFDLVSFGRTPENYHRTFVKAFNQPGSGRIYYRSIPRPLEAFPKTPYEERRDQENFLQLFKILRRSTLALAFDPRIYSGMRQFPFSIITNRWFDCGAAGCVIIGKRPTAPIADKLLDWKDATIELPEDPQTSVEFIKELLQDRPRLASIHKRNYAENLAQHDWRYRIKTMLEQLDIPLPDPLVNELSQLKTLHAQVSR
ncbi:MAG: glycosyltransferase family 1 protein [Chroococcidiopsidaceae cyanobacterium CP_BM_RX_35]|nr:glycosyltransferase family 1 protein [Chroococcidiopsidaceae cyanobacterium CP_BM_RX_35]